MCNTDAGTAAKDRAASRAKDPRLAAITDTPGLPRVLIIGDSISIGYTLPVRAQLRGRANVHRPKDNCGSTLVGLERLDAWLGNGKWDVIHFNFGLHDMSYVDAQGARWRSRSDSSKFPYRNMKRTFARSSHV